MNLPDITEWLSKTFRKLYCLVWGHQFISNHVGTIRCEMCHQPWEIDE